MLVGLFHARYRMRERRRKRGRWEAGRERSVQKSAPKKKDELTAESRRVQFEKARE